MKHSLAIIFAVLTVATVIFLLKPVEEKHFAERRSHETSYERVIRTGTLRCAYINWKPYSLLDPNKPESPPIGTSTEIIEAAADKLGLKVEYVEEIGWGTIGEGFKTNRYDAVCTQMWPDKAKMRNFALSLPVFYSKIRLYGMETDSSRFKDDGIINTNSTRIAVIDGAMSQNLAEENFPNASLVRLTPSVSSAEYYLNVTTKKADLFIGDDDEVAAQKMANPALESVIPYKTITALPHVFAFPMDDMRLVYMMNTAIQQLQNDGTLKIIGQNYNLWAIPAGVH